MTTSEKPAPELITVPNSAPRAAPAVPTVASIVTEARAKTDGEEYVPVAYAADVFLDCWNAADAAMRPVIETILPDYANGNIRKHADFTASLDEIEMALVTTVAFDEVRDA